MRIKAKQMPIGSGVTNGNIYEVLHEVLHECEHFYTITNDDGVEAMVHRNNCEVIPTLN